MIELRPKILMNVIISAYISKKHILRSCAAGHPGLKSSTVTANP